ncbi:MAG: amidase family protein [Thermomicrobiales bacterium]
MKDLTFASATEQADAIRDRQVSAVELLDAHLARIEQHNPTLNAIVTLDMDRARKRAKEADEAQAQGEFWGLLHGVPVTIKDAIATEGIRTTGGFEPLAEYVPAEDAPVVARLKAAGAIVVGKTNLPVLSRDFQCENPIFGRSNNPWDLERTPGGSTGGGAAAIAAGLSPLELGSDIGGSVRIPAHFCGIYSLKPTEHRVPTTGHIPDLPDLPRAVRHMNTIGPLTRSLDDLDLAIRLISGPDGWEIEVPPVPLASIPTPGPGELRLAWADQFGSVPVTRDTAAAIRKLAENLESAGATVEQTLPPGLDFETLWETHGALIHAERASTMSQEEEAAYLRERGLDPDNLDPDSDNPMERGMAKAANASIRDFAAILNRRDAQIQILERFFDEFDALLCPVTATPAIRHCPRNTPIDVDGQPVAYWSAGGGYTGPFNLTGHPAVIVPLTRSAEGLPIGLQIVGPRWSEMKILAIARALEPFVQGYQRPPGY